MELRRHGAEDLVGLCPMHPEKTPSMVISVGKNLFHCFGCGAAGSPLDWVMRLEGVSFRQAFELLRAGYPASGASAGASGRPVKRSTVPKLPCPVEPEAEDCELLGQVMAYYHDCLKRTPSALKYLEKRGLGSMEMIEHFGLGHSDRSLCYGLPAKNRKAGAELRGRLQRLGILRESGHELFRGAIVVPIRDEQGRVVSAYGRKTGEHLREGTVYHLNLDGKMRGVFNVEALLQYNEIIVCEAILDALTFWCAGYKNVVATRGATNFTEEYLEAFLRHGVQRALIAFDRDGAGDRAAAALAERLLGMGIECWRIEFAHGMDANEYALKMRPPAKSLGDRIRKALWLGKGAAPPRDRGALEPAEEAAPASGAQAPAAEDETKPAEHSAPASESEAEPPAVVRAAAMPAPGREMRPAPRDDAAEPELSEEAAPAWPRERPEPRADGGALACESGPEPPCSDQETMPALTEASDPSGREGRERTPIQERIPGDFFFSRPSC